MNEPRPPDHLEAALVDRAMTGDPTGVVQLCAHLAASTPADRDRVLDIVAVGAGRNPAARRSLLEIVMRLRLARGAIAQVVVDPDEIDDIEQLVLLAVDRGIVSFGGRARFRTWLYRVCRNEALMHLRRTQREVDRTSGGEQPGEVVPATRRVSSVVADRDAISRALESLPEIYSDIVRLRALEAQSYAEIADHLGIELNTVRSRLARARHLLDERLREQNAR